MGEGAPFGASACTSEDVEVSRAKHAFEQSVSPARIGILIREVLDRAIDSGRTNRVSIADLTKSAKTAIGTEIEVALRDEIHAPKGAVLDMVLDGVEVDVKWSGACGVPGNSWMVPEEALGGVVVLLTGWDTAEGSFYSLGWLRVPADATGLGKPNKDSKRSILRSTLDNQVLWASQKRAMPSNMLMTMSEEDRHRVLRAPAGVQRITEVFRLLPGRTLTRQELLTLDTPDIDQRMRQVSDALQAEGIVVNSDESGTWCARRV